MQVQNSIWTASLQVVTDWDAEVSKGKQLLESRGRSLEECLLQLSALITRVKWFLHNADTLCTDDPHPANYVLSTRYAEKHLLRVADMLTKEFDLKCALATQNVGPVEKRKLLILTWVTQPYIDRDYLAGLPPSPFSPLTLTN